MVHARLYVRLQALIVCLQLLELVDRLLLRFDDRLFERKDQKLDQKIRDRVVERTTRDKHPAYLYLIFKLIVIKRVHHEIGSELFSPSNAALRFLKSTTDLFEVREESL